MKRKAKIISAVTSLVFFFTFVIYAVWAVQTTTYNITHAVSFTAKGSIYATISATTTAGANTQIASGGTSSAVNLLGDETASSGSFDISPVTLIATSIASGQTVVFSYTITIKNNAPSNITKPNISVKFTPPTTKTYTSGSYGISVSYGGTIGSPAATKVLSSGKTLTMTVTFTCDALVSHVDMGIGGSVELQSAD